MRGRIIFTIGALVLVALPAVAAAQAQQWIISRDPLPSMGVPQLPGPPRLVPLAPSGMPMPTLGLPLPPITRIPPAIARVPPVPASRPVHRNFQGQYRGRTHTYGYNQQVYGPMVYGPTVYASIPLYYTTPIVDAVQRALPPPAAPPEASKGSVALVVEPGTAQVLVDGYYVGTADDFDGTRRTLMLDAGAHNVEISESGYETMRFQVLANASQPIVYRRQLTRTVPPSPAPAPAAAEWKPSPMWAVPGCYLGNVPPKEAGLPASCDASKGVRIR
jgi:hypothetical protein